MKGGHQSHEIQRWHMHRKTGEEHARSTDIDVDIIYI
jgi:hypothetical protein